MLSKLRGNSVMQGSIDYFCLACEALLKSDRDVDNHIVLPTHLKCLLQTKYVDSCIEDRVREVNKRYYCEFCNILLPYKNKVNLHIKEDKHNLNKTEGGNQKKPLVFLKWVKEAVIAFDDVLISSEAWQGFIDENTCIVCEKEFSEPEVHRVETDHIIRLMQAKVQVGNDTIYRKIDDTTFQCLTCNVVITSSEIATHFDEAPHLKLYIERQKAQRAMEKSLAAQKHDLNKIPEIKSAAKPELVSGNNKKAGNTDQEAPKKEQETSKKEQAAPKKEEVSSRKDQEVPKEEKVAPKKVQAAQKKEQTAPAQNRASLKKDPAPKNEPVDVCKALGLRNYINMDSDPTGIMVDCILCGWTIERSGVPKHVSGQHHQTLIKLQEERAEKLKKKKIQENQEEVEELAQEEEPEKIEESEPEYSKGKPKIIDSIPHFQKNHVLIDLITDKAFCTKCSLSLTYSIDIIENHILNHDKKASETGEKYPKLSESHVKTDVKKVKKEDKTFEYEQAKKFASANDLTYNRDNSKAFCRICELKVPSSLKSMEEHVNGMGHQTKKNPEVPEQQAKKVVQEETPECKVKKNEPEDPEYQKTPFDDYCTEVTTFKNFYQHLAIINDKFSLNILSFMMVTKNGDRLRCQVCDVGLTMSNINDHVKTGRHGQGLRDTFVLSGLVDEFVREVRAGVYHCGFCNLVVSGRPALQQHLSCADHKRARMQAEWSLEEHLPDVEQHRMEQQGRMEFMLLMRLLRMW